MTARVLVVDDLLPNVKLLEAKLRAEYFDVLTALSGEEAISIANEQQPDIILLDVMMPGMDGFETCRNLKSNAATCHIPVVMVTALDQQADRLAGLNAGADDFLTKPVQDIALFARVRSLSRLKQMTDELRHRHAQGAELGVVSPAALEELGDEERQIMVVTDDDLIDGLEGGVAELPAACNFTYVSDGRAALEALREGTPDVILVDLGMESYDPLRLCSAVRSFEGSRLAPILAIARSADTRRLVRALDIGVNDYMMRPVDPQEAAARIRTQLKRIRYVENLRASFNETLELAVTDQLTGLYNRRYLATQLPRLMQEARSKGKPLSLMLLDIDHFKRVNDTLGHDVGDMVLKETAERLRLSVRGVDLACRYGGEEFIFVMPDTDTTFAEIVAERLRASIAKDPVKLPDDGLGSSELGVTVSIGVASMDPNDTIETPQSLIKAADEALYRAKDEGRNRVVLRAA
ncbi:PleD family two-component system response regulator [Parvularcula dongshanensis]|uniref:diguanylate cyclase n=1 Tax=Parvularcula dongshanensis TaxID=1173995 RepID=A0A840I3N2_9PROT|nr:PleD family two-component system response regulator [Parvularcula dongshanensis]MBB4659387.1 two-component system cell cycle response regulator [Parvularcula dongshanensis]